MSESEQNYDQQQEYNEFNQQQDQQQDGENFQQDQPIDDFNNNNTNTNDNQLESIDETNLEQQQDDNMGETDPNKNFYFRYYTGHEDQRLGHEFMEFELRGDGTLRYANESGYKKGSKIRKQLKLSEPFFAWIRNFIVDSGIVDAHDDTWPEDNEYGRQEFELVLPGTHIFFVTCKIGSRNELRSYNADPSLEIFYNLTLSIKQWLLDAMGIHFRLGEV